MHRHCPYLLASFQTRAKVVGSKVIMKRYPSRRQQAWLPRGCIDLCGSFGKEVDQWWNFIAICQTSQLLKADLDFGNSINIHGLIVERIRTYMENSPEFRNTSAYCDYRDPRGYITHRRQQLYSVPRMTVSWMLWWRMINVVFLHLAERWNPQKHRDISRPKRCGQMSKLINKTNRGRW